MKILFISLGFITGAILVCGLFVLSSYNSFVSMNVNIDNAWSQVEVQYQRRFDLVPNLVAATKGFMKQEQTVFGNIAEARTHYADTSTGTNERVQATSQYESALSRLLVVMENYPELRSVETVRALTDELAGTENRVATERQRYNEQVNTYNITIKRFPKNLLANLFGFEVREFFKTVEEASVVPKVEL